MRNRNRNRNGCDASDAMILVHRETCQKVHDDLVRRAYASGVSLRPLRAKEDFNPSLLCACGR